MVRTKPNSNISSESRSPGSSPASAGSGTYTGTNSVIHTWDVVSRIESSQFYRDAYALFESGPDPDIWIAQLRGILDGIVVNEPTWFDEFKLSNKWADKVQAIEADAYKAIQLLVQQWYAHVNSLPVSQVTQASAAGINMAITGAGLQQSSVASGLAESSAYQMESTNNLEFGSKILSDVLSVTSSGVNAMSQIIDGYVSLKNLGNETRRTDELIRKGQFDRGDAFDLELQKFELSKDQFDLAEGIAMNSVREHLTSEGFINVPAFENWIAFKKWWNDFGINESADFNVGKRSKRKTLSAAEDVYYSTLDSELSVYSDDGSSKFASDRFQSIVDDMIDFKIDTWQLDFRYQHAKKRYEYLYQLGLDPAKLAKAFNDKSVYDAELSKYSSEIQDYEAKREELKIGRILSWIRQSEHDPKSRAMVAKVLEGINPADLGYIDSYQAREIIDFLNTGNLNPAPASVNVFGSGVSQKR